MSQFRKIMGKPSFVLDEITAPSLVWGGLGWGFFLEAQVPSKMNRLEWQPSPSLWHKLKPLARQMRREPTAAENKLWQRLRNNQIRGVKFRRQFAIERFITDFCSPQLRLIIEVDGPTHEYTQEEDDIRQEVLEGAGFMVLRFTNLDVLNNITAVLDRIEHMVQQKLTPP